LAAAALFFLPELINNTRELMNTLPDIIGKYEQALNGFLSKMQSSKWSDDVKNMVLGQLQNGITAVQNYSDEALKRAMSTLVDTVMLFVDFTIAMVIAYYLIKDGEHFKSYALSMMPRRWRNGLTGSGKEINQILSHFIQGQLLTAFLVGILESIGLMIVNVKYSLVLGMVGGLANVIPYFGPYIGAIPAIAVSLIQSPIKALWAIVVFLVVQQIDNSFISPKVIEGSLGLHPVATIFAVLVGGEFFGILGMLLSVPVLAILRAIFNRAIEGVIKRKEG
jgi:predicted PurR-regulated permease PerM